jgi:hypothetical protein
MYPLGKTVCYMSITHIAFTKEGNQIHPTFEKCGVSLFSLPSSANLDSTNLPIDHSLV